MFLKSRYCNYNSSGVVLYVGGNYNQNDNYGAFYLNGNNSASNSNDNIGCRDLESRIRQRLRCIQTIRAR